jgi:hypothetical protein
MPGIFGRSQSSTGKVGIDRAGERIKQRRAVGESVNAKALP